MIKNIPPNAWGDLLPQPTRVKTASVGISGYDLSYLIKVASHPLAMWVKDNPPKPGEVYVHSVALGATEKVGMNRNFDLYGAEMLARDHGTFEKFARWYYNHQNTDPAKSYGVVRKSFWNEPLGRVEVITALNGTKEAAERNGGLVAERTLNKMASGNDVAVSQSCRVPGDYCNSCDHFARSRAEYCLGDHEGGTCKYGGCRHNLGKTFDDGHQNGVDNRQCTLFDLSDVSDSRGADRTAFITGKVAGIYVPGGAELAEQLGLIAPDYLLEPNSLAQLRCLRKLAAVSTKARPGLPWSFSLAIREKIANAPVKHYSIPSTDPERHTLLADLANAGVALPPAAWLSVVTGVPESKCASVLAKGIDIEKDLLHRPDLHDLLGGFQTDNRLSVKSAYSWMAPTPEAKGREAAISLIKAATEQPTEPVYTPLPKHARDEIAARYGAYLGAAMAINENSLNFPLLLSECASHTRTIERVPWSE